MRHLLAAILAALAIPSSAAGIARNVMEDPNGGTPYTCRWNPYAYIACNAGDCYWVGQFQWHDPPGHPTGIPCA